MADLEGGTSPTSSNIGATDVLEVVPEETRLGQRLDKLQKSMQNERHGIGGHNGEATCDELVQQLKKLCQERDQLVDGLQAAVKEKDAEIAQLKVDREKKQDEQAFLWDAGGVADLLKEPEVGHDSSPEYSGILVEDLIALRDDIIENMEEYCKCHRQDCADLSHVSLEEPCRFSHFHIAWSYLAPETLSDASPASPASDVPPRKLQDLVGNMYLVIERYVKTCLCGCSSYIELINKTKERSALKVTTFVSHSWSEPFTEFIDSLANALVPKESVYVSAFAMDLSRDFDDNLAYDVVNSSFVKALQCSQQMLVVMDAQGSMPKRLWCDFEIVMARSMRKPTFMWPHSSWNGRLVKLQGKIKRLDASLSRTSDKDDERKLKAFIGSTGGSFASFTSMLQAVLLDRLKCFAQACQQVVLETDNERGQGPVKVKLQKARMHEIWARLESEDSRQVTLRDILHGDYEFAEVTGPFFPSSDAVEPVYDPTLGFGCLVSRVRGMNGLNRLKCTGTLELGFGTWRVGFIMRRVLPPQGCALRKEHYYHEDVALSLNGMIEKCTTLSEELGTEWSMLEVGEVTLPSSGLGLITQEVYTGTLSHKSIQKGKTIDISVNLYWSLGRKELYKGSWTFAGKTQALRYEEDGVYQSFMCIDDPSGIGLVGKWVETDNGVVLKGEVEQNGMLSGEFLLTVCEDQLRCSVEIMITGNENGAQKKGLMYSSNAFGKKGGVSLPSLKVPPQLSSSYQSNPKCASKPCECTTRPASDYGLFIDRCYAFRQSPWIPHFEHALAQRSIRAEPSFRVL